MVPSNVLGERAGCFLMATGQQDRGVQARHAVVGGRLAVVGQQAPHHVVVAAHLAQQTVGRRDLHHLRRRQRVDQRGTLFTEAKPEQRLFAVGANQRLREHQIRQVGLADLGEHLVTGHRSLLFPNRCPALWALDQGLEISPSPYLESSFVHTACQMNS